MTSNFYIFEKETETNMGLLSSQEKIFFFKIRQNHCTTSNQERGTLRWVPSMQILCPSSVWSFVYLICTFAVQMPVIGSISSATNSYVILVRQIYPFAGSVILPNFFADDLFCHGFRHKLSQLFSSVKLYSEIVTLILTCYQ